MRLHGLTLTRVGRHGLGFRVTGITGPRGLWAVRSLGGPELHPYTLGKRVFGWRLKEDDKVTVCYSGLTEAAMVRLDMQVEHISLNEAQRHIPTFRLDRLL